MAETEKCLGLTTGFMTTRTNRAVGFLLPVVDLARLNVATAALIVFLDMRTPMPGEVFLAALAFFLVDNFFLLMRE